MRIATWNVNSARARAERMVAFLQRQDVDVLAVQETKCTAQTFPADLFTAIGYEVAHVGYNAWNGVALLSRVGLEDVREHFPHQPGFAKDPTAPQEREARAVGARCGGVEIWSLYVPNGREITDRHYAYKMRWLTHLRNMVRAYPPGARALLVGDFNIAPLDSDVWDMSLFAGLTHVTEPERQVFQMLEEAGLTTTSPQAYTYWDYRANRFGKDEGMRIDFQLATPALAALARGSMVDVGERSGKGASDHAPVIVDYEV